MKAIHLKCEDRRNLTAIKMPVYESGYWDIPEADAVAVVGGMLYLHQTKNDPSYIGGRISEYRFETRPELAHSRRIVFVFEALKEGKGIRWQGVDHVMAWYSGVVET